VKERHDPLYTTDTEFWQHVTRNVQVRHIIV